MSGKHSVTKVLYSVTFWDEGKNMWKTMMYSTDARAREAAKACSRRNPGCMVYVSASYVGYVSHPDQPSEVHMIN